MEAWGPNFYQFRKTKLYKRRRETPPDDFRTLYRFSEINLSWISDHFLGENWDSRGGGLSPVQQMKIFLRYMADPGFQSGVGEDIGCDQTTVSKTIHKVKKQIVAKSHLWIRFPSTPVEVLSAKQEWLEKYTMPCAIGTIDCTHIRINKPNENGNDYVNRKGFTSINVQATCDAKEKFTSVVAEWPGSVHDSRIFRNSNVKRVLEGFTNTVMIGDSGYAIAPYLLTPYTDPRTPQELYFNRIYAKERVTVERCFGQLKMRFPILHYRVRTKLNSVGEIVLCCCILHNVAKYLKDANDFPMLGGDDENGQEIEAPLLNDLRNRQLGQAKRNEVANILFLNRRN